MLFKVKIIYYYKRMSDLELSDNDEVNSILDEDSDNEEIPTTSAIKLNDALPPIIFKTIQPKEDTNIIENSDDDDDDIDSDDDYKPDLDDADDDDDDEDEDMGDDDNSIVNKDGVKNRSKSNTGTAKTKKNTVASSVPQTNINLPMIFEKNDSDYESDTLTS